MNFEFATATRIVFGAGTLKRAGTLASELGRRALVVTGRDKRRAAGLLDLLAKEGVAASVYAVASEPDLEVVRQGVAQARAEGSEVVIAFGGGSVLDAGKAIAAMMRNEGDLLDYLEIIGRGKNLTKLSAPLLAIPTTAGTGSEVTRNAVLASPEHRTKVSLRSPLMLPTAALVDPELTLGLPRTLTASTGMDALTQLIEPYVCLRANPMTEALCEEGMRRVARSLRAAWSDGQNLEARTDMSLASLFGGLALANAGLGVVHGLAGPIGGMFPAPHGAVCAALLPAGMRANISALRAREPASLALERYRKVAALITGDPKAGWDDGVAWVGRLTQDLGIPKLGIYGIEAGHISEIAARAAQTSSMKANPVVLSQKELCGVIESAISKTIPGEEASAGTKWGGA